MCQLLDPFSVVDVRDHQHGFVLIQVPQINVQIVAYGVLPHLKWDKFVISANWLNGKKLYRSNIFQNTGWAASDIIVEIKFTATYWEVYVERIAVAAVVVEPENVSTDDNIDFVLNDYDQYNSPLH